ncbi:histidine phosphatase superfamily [Hypomontagnella submonticulosa]|nr:histidine phosphatase superfamily [Hypomontagnella submonticulosa]
MSPTIDIIRHAQAAHNIFGPDLRDPSLTEEGVEECDLLRERYPFGHHVTHVVSSPMTRTIETTLCGIKPLVKDSIKITLLPELQEVNASPSGTGTAKSVLRELYGPDILDMSALDEEWYIKGPGTPFEPLPSKVEARARLARASLRKIARAAAAQSEHAHVVVVTHGEFAHWLTEDFVGIDLKWNTNWANAECRPYRFVDLYGPDDDNATLVDKYSRVHPITGTKPSAEQQVLGKKEAAIKVQIHARDVIRREERRRKERKEKEKAKKQAEIKQDNAKKEDAKEEGEDEWVDVDD